VINGHFASRYIMSSLGLRTSIEQAERCSARCCSRWFSATSWPTPRGRPALTFADKMTGWTGALFEDILTFVLVVAYIRAFVVGRAAT